MLHEQVIGTFNVESPEPGGFTDTDLQFLEIFSRDVAAALNTLELLVAEKASTAAESIEAIHGAVALPVDDILNDAVNVMERYIGHDAEVVERLQRILRNARDIKQVIQKVGEKMAPSSAHVQLRHGERRPSLAGRRILVVDADEQVRAAAHALLERYGCTVETARDGGEAASRVGLADRHEHPRGRVVHVRKEPEDDRGRAVTRGAHAGGGGIHQDARLTAASIVAASVLTGDREPEVAGLPAAAVHDHEVLSADVRPDAHGAAVALVVDRLALPDADAGARAGVLLPFHHEQVEIGVSNSFGFGGHNACLVFRRWHDERGKASASPQG